MLSSSFCLAFSSIMSTSFRWPYKQRLNLWISCKAKLLLFVYGIAAKYLWHAKRQKVRNMTQLTEMPNDWRRHETFPRVSNTSSAISAAAKMSMPGFSLTCEVNQSCTRISEVSNNTWLWHWANDPWFFTWRATKVHRLGNSCCH